jgi:hypothetical protein
MATNDLKTTLRAVGGFDCVESSEEDNQIRLIGRVQPNMSSNWVSVLHNILLTADGADGWGVDISRTYFLRPLTTGKKLFFAWRFIVQATDMSVATKAIIQAIDNTPKPAFQPVDEFPLPGARGDRNAPGRGGGYAGGVFTTPTGPQAIRR